jgi:hypothetical protein
MNSKTVRIIGVMGALWSLGGVASYLDHVGMLGGEAAAPSSGGATMPVVITAAYATAVFSGVAGSIGLALLKRWAAPLLWLCFGASVVNWGWVFGYSDAGEVPLGVSVLVISLVLAIVASRMPRMAVAAA